MDEMSIAELGVIISFATTVIDEGFINEERMRWIDIRTNAKLILINKINSILLIEPREIN